MKLLIQYFQTKYSKKRLEKIHKFNEDYDGKIYVKTYSNFNEIKNYIVEDPGGIFYDPEVSSQSIQLFITYRTGDSTDEFQAIFIDFVDS